MKKIIIGSMVLALLASVSVTSFAFYDSFVPYFSLSPEEREDNNTLGGTLTIQTEDERVLGEEFKKTTEGFLSGCNACSNYVRKYLDALKEGNLTDAYTYAYNAGRAIDLANSEIWLSHVDNCNHSLAKWDKDVFMMRYEFACSPQLNFVWDCTYGLIDKSKFDLNCSNVNDLLTKLDNLIPEVKEELGKLELAFQEYDLQ